MKNIDILSCLAGVIAFVIILLSAIELSVIIKISTMFVLVLLYALCIVFAVCGKEENDK